MWFKIWNVVSYFYDMKNFVNFQSNTQNSENFTLKLWKYQFEMCSFCPKYMRFKLQKYRGVIFHGTEYWCKIWINANIEVSKMVWRIGWTFMRALKGLKNCTLKGSFCQKHKMFQLVKFRGIKCRDTEGW